MARGEGSGSIKDESSTSGAIRQGSVSSWRQEGWYKEVGGREKGEGVVLSLYLLLNSKEIFKNPLWIASYLIQSATDPEPCI